MAGVIVTSGQNYFNFDFGVLAGMKINGMTLPKRTKRLKLSVEKVEEQADYVEYYVVGDSVPILISHDPFNTFGAVPIQSINGTPPNSISHLFDLLDSLIDPQP